MKDKQERTAKTMQIRKSTFALILALCGVLAVGTAVGLVREYGSLSTYRALTQLSERVKQLYYTDVDDEATRDGALKGYVDGLGDPYSRYMTSEEYESYQTTESGVTVGIGVTVTTTEDGYLHIEEVTADSPAEQAGLQAGDIIMTVGGQDIAELGYDKAVENIRGEEGTTVSLTVRRDDGTFSADIERATVDVATAWGSVLDGNIGYIRISAFRDNTPDQFQEAFDALQSDGAQAFVFDLRDNGGGLVSSLEDILDPLLPEGVIAIATHRDGTTTTLVESGAEECDLPMVVLVNGSTASAAELFAASLSDFGKATIVGTTTFGKGIMQVTEELPSGGALTITTATYQTTRGECYHGVGITPDEVVELDDGAEIDFEAPNPETDAQLQKALDLLK